MSFIYVVLCALFLLLLLFVDDVVVVVIIILSFVLMLSIKYILLFTRSRKYQNTILNKLSYYTHPYCLTQCVHEMVSVIIHFIIWKIFYIKYMVVKTLNDIIMLIFQLFYCITVSHHQHKGVGGKWEWAVLPYRKPS